MKILYILQVPILLCSCGGIVLGGAIVVPQDVDGVSICTGAPAMIQSCSTHEVHLCNKSDEVRTVNVIERRGLGDSYAPKSFSVPPHSTSKNGPLIGYWEYMDGYCKSINFRVERI